mmetsp:Transcript_43042/g.69851  ORF Transcript_43042/g.69851 Transcript_43042/m.69851 type:complete len:487 (-) Transcript_43042:94-1554(-)
MSEGVLLAELRGRKQAVEDYRLRLERLRIENEQLLLDLQRKERDALEVTGFFEDEVRKRDEAFKSLQAAYLAAKDSWGKEREQLEVSWHQKHKELSEKTESQEHSLLQEVHILTEENKVLSEYKENRLLVLAKLQYAEQRVTEQEELHRAEMLALERKYIADKVHIEKEADDHLAELKKRVEEDVVERLDESTKRILQQNRRMGEELRLHVTESEELEKKTKLLDEQNRSLKRELAVTQDLQKEWAAKGQKQSKEIKDLHAKVKSLERSLEQVVKELEDERARTSSANVAAASESQSEIAALKKLVKIRNKEYRQIRKLATEIINQRTEVETFFLDALDYVKRERQAQLDEERRAGQEAYRQQMKEATLKPGVKFPTIRPTTLKTDPTGITGPSQLPTLPGQKVDIKDLTWDDKERVLRLLFAKINNSTAVVPPLPPHLLDTELGDNSVQPELVFEAVEETGDEFLDDNLEDLGGPSSLIGRAHLV